MNFNCIASRSFFKGLFLLLLIATFTTAYGKVQLPSVFSNHMVLQQQTNTAIWGTTAPGKKVVVTPGWNSQQYSTVADARGEWKVKVATPSFGGPYKLTINDGDLTVLEDVMVGEVWVCSGQSNMEMPLAGWGKINNFSNSGCN